MMDSRSWQLRDDSDVQSVQCQCSHLTNEDKQYAAVHLNERDENKEHAIADIKLWINESDDLSARTDDFFILRFLRVCKFNIEKTKVRIRNYYKQRLDLPEWYANRNPFQPEMQELLNQGLGRHLLLGFSNILAGFRIFLFLRKLDDQGRIVLIIRYEQYKTDVQKLSDLIKVGIMAMDVITKDYVLPSLYGFAMFIDLNNVTIHHLTKLHPRIVMNIVHAWQGCYPMRLKLINFINAPRHVHIGLTIFKSFMNEKMKQRLYVYKPNETMMNKCFEDVPVNIRPSEYGGTDGTVQELIECTKKLVEKNHDWFIDDEKYKFLRSSSS